MKQAKVPGTSGAVDLRSVKDGAVGPRERETLQRELEMMAQTRELALRRQVELEQMNEGYSRALSVLVDIYGEDDGEGKKYLVIPGERFAESVARVAAFSMDPGRSTLHLVNTYRYDGKWTVTRDEPSEEQKKELPWFDKLPEFLIRPGEMRAIVGTKKGMRVAEWEPA